MTAAEATNTDIAPQPPSRRPVVLGFIIWLLNLLICASLRLRFENYDRIADLTSGGRGGIIVIWHGRSFIAANVLRGKGYWSMISYSRDGEIQNNIFRRLGFQSIRGSTGRGAIKATLQIARKVKEGGVLAFTPDGPRGPTHKVQGGTILFAQKSGSPIIPISCSARWRKLLRNWDRYLIPLPFSRAIFVVGEPIYVPADLDDAGVAEISEVIERAMNRCEKRAEEMMGHAFPDDYPL